MSGIERIERVRHQLTYRGEQGTRYRNTFAQLCKLPTLDKCIVSTAEHLAPFNFPSTLSFLLPQLSLQVSGCQPLSDIVIFASSLIPLDNADYPRGFFLPDSNGIKNARLNLFSQRWLKSPPILLPTATLPNSGIANQFQQDFPEIAANFFTNFENFATQMASMCQIMAKNWFDWKANISFFPLEEMARQFLIILLRADDHYLTELLFSVTTRTALRENLDHVFCAWSQSHGSFLFWATNSESARLVRLYEFETGILKGDKTTIKIEKETILNLLEKKRLYPSTFLSLFLISWLTEIPIAGGPKQICYWKRMIIATNQVLEANRSIELSVYGYNLIHMDNLQINANQSLFSYGSGLSLYSKKLDPDHILSQLDCRSSNPEVDAYYSSLTGRS